MTPTICEAAQFPQILWSALGGFIVGGICGYYSHQVKEKRMAQATPSRWRERINELNQRWANTAVWFCVISVVIANFGVLWQNQVNSSQDAQRTADNSRFIKCFDDFATNLAGSLPPVRDATAKRDKATEARDRSALAALVGPNGLRGALEKAAADNFQPADLDRLISSFARLQVEAAKLRKANQGLIDARKANPYPAAPSKFCDLP